jgi:hypothetical protein
VKCGRRAGALDLWHVGRRGEVDELRSVACGASGGGVAARRERRWCSDGEGGAWGSEGWRVVAPLGTGECHVGRG